MRSRIDCWSLAQTDMRGLRYCRIRPPARCAAKQLVIEFSSGSFGLARIAVACRDRVNASSRRRGDDCRRRYSMKVRVAARTYFVVRCAGVVRCAAFVELPICHSRDPRFAALRGQQLLAVVLVRPPASFCRPPFTSCSMISGGNRVAVSEAPEQSSWTTY
jgi:hypothetical protein